MKSTTHHWAIFYFIFLFLLIFSSCTTNPLPEEKPASNQLVLNLLRLSVLSYNTTSQLSRFAESNVDFEKFLGTWNEIQRIPISQQGDLRNVQAIYSSRSPNSINVRNQGSSPNGSSVSIDGFALIPAPPRGILKVAFFSFVFSDYFILSVDKENYQHALIGGGSPNVLWLFSRTTTLDPIVQTNYINLASEYGYNVDRLQSFRD